jgi:hypothetical protein
MTETEDDAVQILRVFKKRRAVTSSMSHNISGHIVNLRDYRLRILIFINDIVLRSWIEIFVHKSRQNISYINSYKFDYSFDCCSIAKIKF